MYCIYLCVSFCSFFFVLFFRIVCIWINNNIFQNSYNIFWLFLSENRVKHIEKQQSIKLTGLNNIVNNMNKNNVSALDKKHLNWGNKTERIS